MRVYSWDRANVEHIAKHGVTRAEASYVIEHARPPFPQYQGDQRWNVRGKTKNGRWLQVVFCYPKDEELDIDSLEPHDLLSYSEGEAQVVRVIHARELTEAEKRSTRRRG